MYPGRYIPSSKIMYRNMPTTYMPKMQNGPMGPEEERFFFAPFLVGGLAGTALGYGIANNNQLNNSNYRPPVYGPIYPVYPPYPIGPTSFSNNYYY